MHMCAMQLSASSDCHLEHNRMLEACSGGLQDFQSWLKWVLFDALLRLLVRFTIALCGVACISGLHLKRGMPQGIATCTTLCMTHRNGLVMHCVALCHISLVTAQISWFTDDVVCSRARVRTATDHHDIAVGIMVRHKVPKVAALA